MQVYRDDDVVIAGRPVGPFAMNQYIVGCTRSGEAALIDCGEEPSAFLDFAGKRSLRVTTIYQTHAHIDHIMGLAATRARIDAPIYLHREDLEIYNTAHLQGAMFGMKCDPPPPPDHFIEDKQTLTLGDLSFRVLHTPGHAPGHVCFHEEERGFMFGGDLLFRMSIGRVDLPGSDPQRMTDSLKAIMTLNDDVRVFPGHMTETTIGLERRTNDFLRAIAAGRSLA